MNFIKTTNLFSSKNIIKKRKMQPIKWKQIFIINISDKGLTSRIGFKKEFQKFNNKETNNPIKK